MYIYRISTSKADPQSFPTKVFYIVKTHRAKFFVGIILASYFVYRLIKPIPNPSVINYSYFGDFLSLATLSIVLAFRISRCFKLLKVSDKIFSDKLHSNKPHIGDLDESMYRTSINKGVQEIVIDKSQDPQMQLFELLFQKDKTFTEKEALDLLEKIQEVNLCRFFKNSTVSLLDMAIIKNFPSLVKKMLEKSPGQDFDSYYGQPEDVCDVFNTSLGLAIDFLAIKKNELNSDHSPEERESIQEQISRRRSIVFSLLPRSTDFTREWEDFKLDDEEIQQAYFAESSREKLHSTYRTSSCCGVFISAKDKLLKFIC